MKTKYRAYVVSDKFQRGTQGFKQELVHAMLAMALFHKSAICTQSDCLINFIKKFQPSCSIKGN